MRKINRYIAIALLALSGWTALPSPKVSAASGDTVADRVFGQPDFVTASDNTGGVSDHSLANPTSAALDSHGNLFVADTNNNRVLEFDAPLLSGSASLSADRVFGQKDFTSTTPNAGGISASSLSGPTGVALDARGNLYVVDYYNSRVLEYDAPFTKSGSPPAADRVFGQPDFLTGTSNTGGVSSHSLSAPLDVAVDGQGNVYIADSFNDRVLEYNTPLATDTDADRVFGQPDFTSNSANNGGISSATLNIPESVTVDGQGNLYLADSSNQRALEYNRPLVSGAPGSGWGDSVADFVFGQPDFTSNAANNGGVTSSSLYNPTGVAVDASGNVYIADFLNNRVLEYNVVPKDAVADHVFGQANFTSNLANAPGLNAASLSHPRGVVMDAENNLYVVDHFNNRVPEFDQPLPNGVPTLEAISPFTVAAGSPGFTLTVNGFGFVPGSTVRWNGSDRLTTYLSSTQLEAAITASDIHAPDAIAVTVSTPPPGGGTSALINLALYQRVAKDSIADTLQGQPNFQSNALNNPLLPGGANRLNFPAALVVDPRAKRLFVSDRNNNRVLSWPDAPSFVNGQAADLVIGQPDFSTTTANTGGVSGSSLSSPSGLAVDARGDLYVADSGNNRVLVFAPPFASHMAASQVYGQGGAYNTNIPNDGGVSENSLEHPAGVALDGQGRVYIADFLNNRVLEYDPPQIGDPTPDTTADRVIGQPDFISNAQNNGGLNASGLSGPVSLALNSKGNLFIADSQNSRVLEYDEPLASWSGAVADRVFGQANFTSGIGNNGGISASTLESPESVAVDSLDRLYVADFFNNRVLEYDQPLSSKAAVRVFGQPDFTTFTANTGGLGARSLAGPIGVALDAEDNLYAADYFNNRVLEYDATLVRARLGLPFIAQ